MPPREKGAKACLQDWAGHFLRSGLNVKDAELRPFLAILRAIQADFSALQTVWRSERDSNSRSGFWNPVKGHTCATCKGFCINNLHRENRDDGNRRQDYSGFMIWRKAN